MSRENMEVVRRVFEATSRRDAAAVATPMRGRGRSSGSEVEWPQYALWTIRDSKVVRAQWFRTRDKALEAAGLRE